MSFRTMLSLVVLVAAVNAAHAETLPGVSFSHNDWQLVCDNSRTCRAAGYTDETVSVLVTRKAGANEAPSVQLQLASYGEEEKRLFEKFPQTFDLKMRVNGRNLGVVTMTKGQLVADLSEAQTVALLAALTRESEIEWVHGKQHWQLSDQGAAAVLLKMDEFQGRIGTTGALIKKGSRSEDRVLPPLSVPEVVAAPLEKPRSGDDQWLGKHGKALLKALRATMKDDDQGLDLQTGFAEDKETSLTRLTDTKLLLSAQCWTAAYNSGCSYWVINDKPPYRPVLVTSSGQDERDGSISSSQKGRGLGDCGYSENWTWDGKEFIQTRSVSTGMCKLIAPGGAWSLPLIVTNVGLAPN